MADNDSTSDILDKLDYLDNTKQQIRTALNNKGLNIDTITPFRNYAAEIDTLHIGTDTTDADATSYDIISPRTAYVNDVKITGRVPKITDEFSFNNIEITQTSEDNSLIKDYIMTDERIFHKEYLNGINLIGKDFLIYMRPDYDESQAIVFTWNNTEELDLSFNNNTMILRANHLTTYTDLFLGGNPTITTGPYSGIYFGNNSYFSTQKIEDNNSTLIFKQCEKLEYEYLTIDQSFDETTAISSTANNKLNIEQQAIANMVGLLPDILKSGNKVLNVEGTLEPIRLFSSIDEMDNSSGNNKDDLGVVYSEGFKEGEVQVGDIVTLNFLPDELVFDEAIEENSSFRIYLRAVDYSSGTSTSYIYIRPEEISGEIRVTLRNSTGYFWFRYYSEDGITYTKQYTENEGMPNEVLLYSVAEDIYNIVPQIFKLCDYKYEGLYSYNNSIDNEIFNNITDFKCNETTVDETTTYLYYTENKMFRLPKLRTLVQNIFIEQELQTSGNFGVFINKNTNKISLINQRINIIYDHQSEKAYLGITISNYNEWYIDKYEDKHENKTQRTIQTQPLNDYFYILGSFDELEYITTGSYNASTSSTSLDNISLSINLYRILNNIRTSIGTNSNIKYNNTNFEAYHHITTKNNLEYKYQLLPNIEALGIHGLIKGDGSYINHISNKEFSDNWLDGSTATNSDYSGIIKSGAYVPNQTFVSTEPIICNYRTGIDLQSSDDITYKNIQTISSTIDLNDEEFLDEYNNCSYSTTSYTSYVNQIPYYVQIKFEGSKESDTNLWSNITKVTAVIFNQLTGEIYKTFKCTTSFHPTDISNSSSHDYCGYMQSCGYSFSEDKIYIFFSTGNWGWSNTAYGSTVSISNTGVLNRIAWNIVPSGSSVRTYKQIDQSGVVWDDINNQFYGLIESWDKDGDIYTHSYNGMVKINMEGATQIRQNTDPSKFMYTSNSRGQGPLYKYYDGDSQKYILLDASNNTIILQGISSSMNIIGINGYQYYVYNESLYKYDPINHSASVINNNFTGSDVYRLFKSNIEYLWDGRNEGKLYDTNGNEVQDISNISANDYIEEIDDYTRRINGLYNYSVINYSSGSRTTTKTDYIRTYNKWFIVNSFPYIGDLYIVINGSNYNKRYKTCKYYAKQLTKCPVSNKEYQENLELTDDILGIE